MGETWSTDLTLLHVVKDITIKGGIVLGSLKVSVDLGNQHSQCPLLLFTDCHVTQSVQWLSFPCY